MFDPRIPKASTNCCSKDALRGFSTFAAQTSFLLTYWSYAYTRDRYRTFSPCPTFTTYFFGLDFGCRIHVGYFTLASNKELLSLQLA